MGVIPIIFLVLLILAGIVLFLWMTYWIAGDLILFRIKAMKSRRK
jgi:hypothetical protein